jgi:hypothetical protein
MAKLSVQQASAINRVITAWDNPGPHPEFHAAAKEQLLLWWPTLYRSVEELAEHGPVPIFDPSNEVICYCTHMDGRTYEDPNHPCTFHHPKDSQ